MAKKIEEIRKFYEKNCAAIMEKSEEAFWAAVRNKGWVYEVVLSENDKLYIYEHYDGVNGRPIEIWDGRDISICRFCFSFEDDDIPEDYLIGNGLTSGI